MEKKNIELLDMEVITAEQLEAIEEYAEVQNTECLGTSGCVKGCYWYSVEFANGESVDVYLDCNAYAA